MGPHERALVIVQEGNAVVRSRWWVEDVVRKGQIQNLLHLELNRFADGWEIRYKRNTAVKDDFQSLGLSNWRCHLLRKRQWGQIETKCLTPNVFCLMSTLHIQVGI
jgi:hypothetical protein